VGVVLIKLLVQLANMSKVCTTLIKHIESFKTEYSHYVISMALLKRKQIFLENKFKIFDNLLVILCSLKNIHEMT